MAGGRTLFLADRGVCVLHTADLRVDPCPRGQVPPVSPSPPTADRRLAASGTCLDLDTARHLHGLFCLGLADFLPGGSPPEGSDGSLCRRQAVDVEVRVRGRTA